MSLLDELHDRHLVRDVTEGLSKRLEQQEPMRVYYGVDPTAPSLHHGNLIGLLNLQRFIRAGHEAIVVIGGATALIGDPSGRNTERPLLDPHDTSRHALEIARQVRSVIGHDIEIYNNISWTQELSLLDFLRTTGTQATVAQMLTKESVKRRLDTGLTFTEFAYMLMQAYDYHWLYGWENVELQIGGSDQWGNMLAGVDLIRRRTGKDVHALSWPLLTDAAGDKIGKTAGAKLWLDPELTTPYAFYQHFINTPDSDVHRMLAWYTLLPMAEIEALGPGGAQRTLALEVTSIVHGDKAAALAATASLYLFDGNPQDTTAEVLEVITKEIPTVAGPIDTIDALVQGGLASSKRDARQLVDGGSVHTTTLLHDRWILIRKGKKHWMAIEQ